ncbi:hypothetical protein [Brevundimonas naejangsanensis]|uniref:hypothetical protein n=1 Tax=Brevundimonas naejangsanensis TaxID=588932 RepID=UPI00106D3AD8|nr:hypothetical protein [Brevundimonas naejangsanensis]QBQ49075.1 hypothetical protein E3U41_10505 [Brevundimonas naejangsanensis]
MSRVALPQDEADLLKRVLCEMPEVNLWNPGPRHPWLPLAQELARRGFVALTPDRFGGAEVTVTATGARALIEAGVIKARELAGGADRLLRVLINYRAGYEAGRTDPSLGDLSWGAIRDSPHNRAALSVLKRRGLIEERSKTAQEIEHLAGCRFVRATDAGMRA